MLKSILTSLLALICLSACGNNNSNTNQMKSSTDNPETSAATQLDLNGKKVLVAFFSRTGENYGVGHITKGNTHIVAELIAAKTGGTLFQIEPAKAYPDGYDDCVAQAKTEQQQKARPAIKADAPVEDYDVIFLGYPNWWGDMPMPVYTFLEAHNWEGKTVVPFCTHEGSGLSDTEDYVKATCKGATVLSGFALQGRTAQNDADKAEAAVEKWLNGLSL